MEKIIIDCDPGIDDAMAILLAARSPSLQIIGLTSVFGNAAIETTTDNAVRLRDMFEIEAPVHVGARLPLSMTEDPLPTFVHGKDGLGDTRQLPSVGDPDGDSAANFIVETINANPHQVSIVALGRLTNLANALALDPGIAALTKQTVVMGGAFGFDQTRGNVTPCAEANIYGDPDAADQVCLSGWNTVFVGLDVTMKCIFDHQRLNRLRDSGDAACEFIADISRFYQSFYNSIGYRKGFPVHDASAMAYLIEPTFFKVASGPVRVATSGIAKGATIWSRQTARDYAEDHWKGVAESTVCCDVVADRLLNLVESTLLGDPKS